MSDQLTPDERYTILSAAIAHAKHLRDSQPEARLLTGAECSQFVRESIADACAAIDAAVAPVPTEEEIANG